jgi:hypothetical protein
MKALLPILFITSVMANNLLFDYQHNQRLRVQLKENPTFLNRALLGPKQIVLHQLGQAISPFFQAHNPYRYYRNHLKQCYRLEVRADKNTAKKIKCPQRMTIKLSYQGNQYDRVTGPLNLKQRVLIDDIYQSHVTAHTHQMRRVSDLDQLGAYPTRKIEFSYQLQQKLVEDQLGLEIVTTPRVWIAPMVLNRGSSYQFQSSLRVDFHSNLDFIFREGDTLLLYKRYQPKPFRMHLETQSQGYLDYLEDLEQHLYQFNGIGRCFRDDLLQPTAFDCHRLITRDKQFRFFASFSLIKINLRTNEIELLP